VAKASATGGCFAACPQPSNTSSPCWIRCYFDSLLGAGAGTKVGRGRRSYVHAPLFVLCGEPLMKDAGRCKNDSAPPAG
jgi:hypothetical protein